MSGAWSGYGTFVLLTVVLVLVPGPDFAVVVRNTLAGGRRRGAWSAVGITASNVVQGTAAATGLAAVVVRAEPLFQAIRWIGVGYLAYLAVQAFVSAVRGRYADLDGGGAAVGRGALTGLRQGFLSNVTNPKVLAFYLAVLPQFLGPGTAVPVLMAYALTHAAVGLVWLLFLVAVLHRARLLLARRPVRRALDAFTGCALLAFGARLAADRG
ncbi:Threonine/homoserine/homoserine lactone efflux protein [Geodermatophilus dictyosporus]|uniref:Threonine/homoserine/homoserine lactone efflux protein n=1 Tax=Geodermatophilus dictyosporus TaxID=1523247 RepID=A0A1I5TNU4_9ACTN|nr:LysE family translocator [Geodermatophilus dictyosporus]SFP84277.1 Threonine/homoserine/homoserine lactone efflux protein [Geodermatophilus dictyosporus]